MSTKTILKNNGKICTQHPGEHLKFYCTVHNDVVCSICAVKLHKACDDTLTIDEAVERFEYERNDLLKALDNQNNEIINALVKKQSANEYLSSTSTDTVSKIHDVAKALYTTVQAKERELILAAEQMKQDHQDILQSDIDSLQQLLSVASRIQQKAYKAFDKEAQLDTVLTIAKVQNAFCEIERCATDAIERPNLKLDFHTAQEIHQFLHGFDSLGEIVLCNQEQETIRDTPINVVSNVSSTGKQFDNKVNPDADYMNTPPPATEVCPPVVNGSDQMKDKHDCTSDISIHEDRSPSSPIPCFNKIVSTSLDSDSSSGNETDDESSETHEAGDIHTQLENEMDAKSTDSIGHDNNEMPTPGTTIDAVSCVQLLISHSETINESDTPDNAMVTIDETIDVTQTDGNMGGIPAHCDNDIQTPDNSTDEEIMDDIPTHVADEINIEEHATDADSIDEIPANDGNEMRIPENTTEDIVIAEMSTHVANEVHTTDNETENKINAMSADEIHTQNNFISTGNEMSPHIVITIQEREDELDCAANAMIANEAGESNSPEIGNEIRTSHVQNIEKDKHTGYQDKHVIPNNEDSARSFQTVNHGKPCWIYGLAYLPDKRLVVTDVAHDSLQLYGNDHQLLGETRVNFTPWGVAAVNDTTIAVCSGGKQTLNIFSIDKNTFIHVRDFDLGTDCISVTYKDNVFTTGARKGIVLASEDGNILSRIEQSSDNNEGFRRVDFLTADSVSGNVFIVNSWASKTVCVAPDGRKNWEYTSIEVNPRGVAWYNGRLYVASRNQHKILAISEDGAYLDEVGREGLVFPYAVAIRPRSATMAVSQWDEHMEAEKSRTIMVFRIADM